MRGVGAIGLGVLITVSALAGCTSGPRYGPNDEGIPEARALANAELEAYVERIEFSDQVTVLAEGRADGCGTHTDATVFQDVTGYYCSTAWMAVVTLSPSATREEFAARLDLEFQTMDVGYTPWNLVSALALNYPSNRHWAPLAGGGRVGEVSLTVETNPFPDGGWRTPRIARGITEVSSSGNLDDVTQTMVTATGATEVVTVTARVSYWDTQGLSEPRDPFADGIWTGDFEEGARYRFDLIAPVPQDGLTPCLADPVVDQATVAFASTPFPRVGFELTADTPGEDVIRVRECLYASLESGTLIVYSPLMPE